MDLVHASHIFWASWLDLVWLCGMDPVLLCIEFGSPISSGGVSYSESPDSDSVSSCLWGCAMCISKFLWTTQVCPSPCHILEASVAIQQPSI